MFNVSRRILYVMLLLMVTVAINAVSMVAFIRDVRFDARAINEIGILRGLPQRVVKMETAGIPSDRLIRRVDGLFAKYDSRYNRHRFLDIETSFGVSLRALDRRWEQVKAAVYRFRKSGSARDKRLLLDLSEGYWRFANHTVFSVESISEEKVSHLWYLFIPIILNLSLIVIAIVMLKKWVQNKLEMMANYDGLTGLMNRAAFYGIFGKTLDNAERHGRPTALLMMDLDHFKSINDTLGHDTGDRVLRDFSQNLLASVRGGDLAARIGGEEFVVLAPETDPKAAEILADRIRQATAGKDFPGAGRLTISIGVAFYRPGEAMDDLIKRADDALYRAKRNGRNRVEIAED